MGGGYIFNFYIGSEGISGKLGVDFVPFAWAVRDGNVVPVPAAVWLFGSGMLGLIGIARRKKAV